MKSVQIKNKKLRVAMIGHKRIPSREGGVEIVVEELSKRLVEKGHYVMAYNRRGHHVSGREFNGESNIENLKKYKGINITTVPTIKFKGLAAVTSSLFATIKALFGKYDCIHYHAEGPCLMLILPHLFGIRTVATIHGLDWARDKWGRMASFYLKLGEKIAAKYADEVIVLSKNVQMYFMDKYNRKTVYISNGVTKPEIISNDLIKEKWNLEKDSYILFLGRVVPEKGLEYLVKAFKKVNTDKKLVIAGGASDTDDFMKKVKALSRDDKRIIFTGFVEGEILEELYSNSYIYVLPSDLEGMPISLLEAMSYENCCLVSDIPECMEVVQDKAVNFKRGNIEDLREKLQELCLNSSKVKTYKKIAREYICSKYNWDNVVDETINLYYQNDNNLITSFEVK